MACMCGGHAGCESKPESEESDMEDWAESAWENMSYGANGEWQTGWDLYWIQKCSHKSARIIESWEKKDMG